MIEERFLRNAVKIRRNYLKLTTNLQMYQSAAVSLKKKLDDILNSINEIENSYVEKKIDDKTVANEILKVIDEVELEGKKLEDLIKPINDEIESLSKEEQELYRQITNHHYNLSNDEIIFYVKDRLIKEGLS